MILQQGDVIIKKIEKVKGKKLNHKTLAKGEKTGHHHTITKGEADLYDEGDIKYLRVKSEKATLTHQEHAPIEIEKGDYQIGIVREHDHLNDETRNVSD